MAGIELNFDELDEWVEKLATAVEQQFPDEFKEMVVQVAYELQGLVKENTPIGPTGKLADSWVVGEIVVVDGLYMIEVYTNVEYAEPVEEGHRTRLGTGQIASKVGGVAFVPGRHMMQISIDKVEQRLPEYLQEWLSEFISTHDLA